MHKNILFSLALLLVLIVPALAQEKVLRLASSEPTATHQMYYCSVKHVFEKMGYKVHIENIPLIRGEVEAKKGNYPLIDIFRLSFHTDSAYNGNSTGIDVTKTPYLTEPVNVYTRLKDGIVVNKFTPLSSYKVGVVRNQYSQDQITKDKNNYTFYSTSFAAFKGLSLGRIDLVISPPKAFQAIKANIKNSSEISVLFSYGSVYRHIGFSQKYFGIDKAKFLAKEYEREIVKYFESPISSCSTPSI